MNKIIQYIIQYIWFENADYKKWKKQNQQWKEFTTFGTIDGKKPEDIFKLNKIPVDDFVQKGIQNLKENLKQ